MNLSNRNFRSYFLAFVFVAAVAAPAGAAEPCDPLFTDGSLLESTRSWIDLACPCGQYDGSDGKERSDFKKCVSGQIKLAIEAEGLNKKCKGLLKKMYSTSVCGSGNDELAPCVEESATGKVSCRIRTATDCQERSGDVCLNRPTCVDGADTNGDYVVNAPDSGVCFPPLPTTTSTTTTSTTSTSTTSTTTSTLPSLYGEDSPDILIEVNRGTDFYETVSEWCTQTPTSGGCPLISDLDGSGDDIDGQYFYADGTTDERVCSQEDAALSYKWEILFPPTLGAALVIAPWITNVDSPTLRIPPSGLPDLEETDAGSDTFWRMRLTVTPRPLDGEEFTPAASVLYFRFNYRQTDLQLSCFNELMFDHSCQRAGCVLHCGPNYCDRWPEHCL
jgi:hypothetical protein